jgi:hypothetical protein
VNSQTEPKGTVLEAKRVNIRLNNFVQRGPSYAKQPQLVRFGTSHFEFPYLHHVDVREYRRFLIIRTCSPDGPAGDSQTKPYGK